MTGLTTTPPTTIEIEFNYASLILEPYSGSDSYSSKLLKEVLSKLNDAAFPQNKRIIDRFANRTGTERRNLIIISSPFEKGGLRSFGKIALIKNKAPQLLVGKDVIEEIEKPENKQFIEVTNFIINFNPNSDPVIMIEYNHSGPRLSDIEYYFRQISKDFRIAKSIKSSLHLNVEYSDLSNKIENIFGVTVKVKANEVSKSSGADWHNTLKTLKDDSGFTDARLEVFYKREKEVNTGKYIKNIRGLAFGRNILDWLKKSLTNIENVDDLKMTYQLEGSDEIVDLDFLKNKRTSIVSVALFNKSQYKQVDFKHIVGQEFNVYLTTGKTNQDYIQ